MSAEENAQLRERRANDEAYRQRENATKARYAARKKAALTGEPIPEDAALVRNKPEDPADRWFRDGVLLNHEDPQVVATTKRSVIHRFEVLVNLSSAERQRITRATAYFDPPEEKEIDEPAESFGLADDR